MQSNEKFEIFTEFIGNTIQKESTFPFMEYTEYTIKILTKFKTWIIKKRYSEFHKLHKNLKNLIPNLPFFPSKKLFSTKLKIVNDRILFLENYLNEALKIVNKQIFSKVYEFLYNFVNLGSLKSININEPTYHEKNKMNILSTESTILDSYSSELDRTDIDKTIKFKTSRSEECLISFEILKKYCPIVNSVNETLTEFLTSISLEEEDQTMLCKIFLNYMSSNWTNFKFDDIFRLFFGNNDNKEGLVYYAGKIEENPFGSYACLELLYNILNFEVNPDCEYYIHVFKYGEVDDIRLLNFLDYYKSYKRDSLIMCLKLLKIWLINNDKKKLKVDDMIDNESLLSIYKKYCS